MEANILLWIQDNLRNEFLTPIFIFVTTIGNGGIIWIILTLLMLIPKNTRKIGIMSVNTLVWWVVIGNLILKNIVARVRPYDAIDGLTSIVGAQSDYSFPSGHTGCAFAVAVVMFMGLPKRYGIPAMILAFLIGFSRLYVGVHYPSDVIGGAIIGTCIAIITYFVGNRLAMAYDSRS